MQKWRIIIILEHVVVGTRREEHSENVQCIRVVCDSNGAILSNPCGWVRDLLKQQANCIGLSVSDRRDQSGVQTSQEKRFS
jgi:hypothetical protein